MEHELVEDIKRLKALADIGMLYAKNEYDVERYTELQELSLQMLGKLSSHSVEALELYLPPGKDYPTAKVDIRCLILSGDNQILLTKESTDGKWSLPGGWGDIGHSPKETAVKESKEETGLDVEVKALLAVFDKKMHPHPPQPFYVYKMVFYCTPLSQHIKKGFDVLDVQYFDIATLPALSEDRILKSQIELVYQKAINKDFITYCD